MTKTHKKIPLKSITALTNITNDLRNFTLIGVLFFRGLQDLPMPGIESPDDWRWVDLPYESVEPQSNKYSEMICQLRLLIRRAYIKLTYCYLHSGVCSVRVYFLNQEVSKTETIQWFRENFCRFRKTQVVIDKICLQLIRKLYTVLDFSIDAVDIDNKSKFISYIKTNNILVFNFAKSEKDITVQFDEDNTENFNYHIARFINRLSNQKYETNPINQLLDSSLKSRVLNIYTKFKSPIVDRGNLNTFQVEMYTTIMNGEIPGFKSVLYNYQRRSVAKMFEKETITRMQFMPYIIKTDDSKFVDLRTMEPVLHPPTFNAPKGGILAENMGLGKTCICLALICLTKFQISENPKPKTTNMEGNNSLVDICSEFINQNSISWKQYYDYFPKHLIEKLESKKGYFEEREVQHNQYKTRRSIEVAFGDHQHPKRFYLTSCTLVVIPDNLFHQWNLEVAKHIQKNYLNILEISTVRSSVPEKEDILNYDAVFISMSAFSRQSQDKESVLRMVYWKRLIIDEGHSMNSKTTQAVQFARELKYERMWAISGTPTSGMTNLHVEDDNQEYTVTMNFDAKQDLIKLGSIISNFMKIEPWNSKPKIWNESIVKPMIQNQFGIDLQLEDLLNTIIVRHTINDVESDIKLPKLHHKPVFLQPSFFDQLSINLFVSVLATNAVTSERKDVDYMFHPSNKSDLRRLITNLRKATFYWTGFSINDVQNLLNICVFALNKNGDKYSKEDNMLLKRSIFISKLALSNMRWRSSTTIHEMGFFINNLPSPVSSNYSLVHYNSNAYIYGFPQIISLQKFFYKNRLMKTIDELTSKVQTDANEFWKGYWKSITNSKQKESRPVSNKDEYSDFNTNDIETIGEIPTWVDGFDPLLEEDLFFDIQHEKKRKLEDLIEEYESKKRVKLDYNINTQSVGSFMRNSQIIGTSSSKLTYLTLKLLENQKLGIKSIVFYEFENSAYYLTEFMDVIGMNYIMYSTYIKPSERSKNLAQFDSWDSFNGNGVCLIMDLKLASHGLTIIAATHVYFINPVWNKTIEAQAIKRSHRIGQINEVYVETIILKDTIEEEMYLRRGSDENEEDNQEKEIELIDHSQMKDYILKFPFLRMFDMSSYQGEYSPMEYGSELKDEISAKERENPSEDNLKLETVSSVYDMKNNTRKWTIPLFTEMNMSQLSNKKSKFKGDFDLAKNLEEVQDNNKEDREEQTIKLLKKLREDKRTVRFSI